MAESAKWYVIHTYSGYEKNVKENITKVVENRKLQHLIQEVKVPIEKVTEISNGKSKDVERKVYPCYVLIKMVYTDETWYIVRNTRGVTGFVGPASEPTPLSEKEVEALGVELNSVEVDYKVGDVVKINGTSMDGLTGVVQSINYDDKTVNVLVSMFGRETPTTLALNQVVSLDN